jgi:hypothetical protein
MSDNSRMPAVPAPREESIERLRGLLHLSTPLIGVYDARPSDDFAPMVRAEETNCCFAYYDRWLAGETLVFEKGGGGCKGAHAGLGLERHTAPFAAHFLTDGVGAPRAEGLKATPEIAQAYLDSVAPPPPEVESDAVLIGPLRLAAWDRLRSVTFLVDPDRFAAVLTLAGYWSARDVGVAPFGSGCALMWRALGAFPDGTAVIGATDVAMRKHLPPDVLTLSVGPAHFAKMVTVPDASFLSLADWKGIIEKRGL